MFGVKHLQFPKSTPYPTLSFNLLGMDCDVILRNEKILKNKGHQAHQAHQGE